VVEPLVPANRDAVIGFQPLVVAGRQKPFTAPAQQLRQIDGIGAVLLLVGEMNVLCDGARPLTLIWNDVIRLLLLIVRLVALGDLLFLHPAAELLIDAVPDAARLRRRVVLKHPTHVMQ
jgi:hypothetical protein